MNNSDFAFLEDIEAALADEAVQKGFDDIASLLAALADDAE